MSKQTNGSASQGERPQMTVEQVKAALKSDLQVIHVLITMLRNSDRLLTVLCEEMAAIENETREVRNAKQEAGLANA